METAAAPRVQALADAGVSRLPAQYIQPPDLRPTPSHRPPAASLSVPVVDLSAGAAAVDAVRGACAEWGAFHVVNHGVPPGLLDAMRGAGLAFFRAPMEDKLRFGCDPAKGAAAEGYGSRMLANDDSVLDWRDYFDHHTLPESRRDPAHWPDFVPSYSLLQVGPIAKTVGKSRYREREREAENQGSKGGRQGGARRRRQQGEATAVSTKMESGEEGDPMGSGVAARGGRWRSGGGARRTGRGRNGSAVLERERRLRGSMSNWEVVGAPRSSRRWRGGAVAGWRRRWRGEANVAAVPWRKGADVGGRERSGEVRRCSSRRNRRGTHRSKADEVEAVSTKVE